MKPKMTLQSVLILILAASGLVACNKPVSFDEHASTGYTANEMMVYKVTRTMGATTDTEDVAYVDFTNSRLVIADFDVCFTSIPLTEEDIADIRAYWMGASMNQASAQAACSASGDSYTATSTTTSASYAVCGTSLQTKFEEIMARPGTRMCKPTAE